MKSRMRVIGAVVAVMLAAAACQTPSYGTGGGPASWAVAPEDADAATTPDPSKPNLVYEPIGYQRDALAVVLHGTGSAPNAHLELVGTLRNDGYHVIVLRYSASLGTLNACPDAIALADPDCHRTFRSETVFGAGVPDPDGVARDHATANIPGPNSVSNRLLKLVEHMNVIVPNSGFANFQQKTNGTCDNVNANYGACELDWSKVSVLGHSQGGGVALYMAKQLPLAAAGLLSAPYDAFDDLGVATAAPWTTENDFETPASSIRTLMHTADYGAGRIRAAADAVGIPGPEVSATAPPFTSNRLLTSVASTCPWDSVPGHNSTAVDVCVPNGAYHDAWLYLAGS